MNCEEMRAKLDAYMDGELAEAELRAMEDHAAACEDCRGEWATAQLVREALADLPDEVDVPLSAQAAWRSAVRAEAKRQRNRRWLRWGYAAAAALVLALGAAAVLGGIPGRRAAEPITLAAAPTQAVVAYDGDAAAAALLQDEAYAAWKKYAAEDFDAACASVEALAEEYGGEYSAEKRQEPDRPGEDWAVYRVELPREYLEDFLSAASHLGAEEDSETMDTAGDSALVYIQIDERIPE